MSSRSRSPTSGCRSIRNVQILVDERTLREIYLPVFESAVKAGHAATVMGAYNAINGFFCCENPFLLKNAGNFLPLKAGQVHSMAVLGTAAQGSPPTGFGSSYVTPISFVSELDGIENSAAPGTTVDLISTNTLDPQNTLWEFSDAKGELEQGLQAEYFTSNDLSGTPAVTRVDQHLNFDWDVDPILQAPPNFAKYDAVVICGRNQ